MAFYAAKKYRPKTRHMYLEEDRLKTFHSDNPTVCYKTWPKSLRQEPNSLAKSGFYYTGYSDLVICFYCDLHLASWNADDNPTIEHCRHNPYCSFMAHIHGLKYMSFFKPFCQNATWELELKFKKINQKTFTIKHSKTNSIQTIRQPDNSLTKIENKHVKNSPPYIKLQIKYKKLQTKYLMLKNKMQCTICMAAVKDTIVMPCAHLATCLDCTAQLYDCPLCRTPIKFISSVYT